MSNFKINFTQPWLLLLLIPALILVLYTFFKVARKFRYTRNRVISFILSIICVTLATFMASGINISYDKVNNNNEIILLVDSSFSNVEHNKEKNSFVKAVLDNSVDNVKVGVVTFGYDQVYAVPLTKNTDMAYDQYLQAPKPDDSASDIESALLYTKSLFTHPKSGKIVLATDGIQTEGDIMKTVAALSVDGIRVDVVNYVNKTVKNEIQPLKVQLPEETIIANENTQIKLEVQSSIKTDAVIKFYDNGKLIDSKYVNIKKGINEIFFSHTFDTNGLHELSFSVESSKDTLKENNVIYSYVNIQLVNKILILQKEDEGTKLNEILNKDYSVEIRKIIDAPKTLDELRNYDQIMLVNIANADMPQGLDVILNDYVQKIGGGLLTVGGKKVENGQEVANVYNRADMKDTLYQEMLPVIAEDYRPPIAVMLVIDTSGSMSSELPSGKTQMEEARVAAKEGLKALDNRDYAGVITFSDNATLVLPPTPLTKRKTIENAIDRIEYKMEGTVYSHGMEKAGLALKSVIGVNKKHIMLISDGEPSSSDKSYIEKTLSNYESGVTTSIIMSYVSNVTQTSLMKEIAKTGHGHSYIARTSAELAQAIKQDVTTPEIKEYEFKTFQPMIAETSEIFKGVAQSEIPSLDGFYGTKIKKDAITIMKGEYGEPIYAQWAYGKGKVGSFMCDLNGDMSKDFVQDVSGQKIIKNITDNLFPLEPVKKETIELDISRDNYKVKTNIYSNIADGESVRAVVSKLDTKDGDKQVVHNIDVEDFNGNSTIHFDIKQSGLYEIKVEKLDSSGNVIDENTKYQEFSYSQEYNPFLGENVDDNFINEIAIKGDGHVLKSGENVYDDLVLIFHKILDPRYAFATIIIISMLLDIAVRKFKFKWIHEIIKDKKNK